MTVYELEREYRRKHHDGHFFDRDTLKFFGETLSTMYVWKTPRKVADCMGEVRTCWVLSSLQNKHPRGSRGAYYYFDVETFDDIIPMIQRHEEGA